MWEPKSDQFHNTVSDVAEKLVQATDLPMFSCLQNGCKPWVEPRSMSTTSKYLSVSSLGPFFNEVTSLSETQFPVKLHHGNFP